MIAALQIADGHILEKFCGVLSDSRIGCHQGQIGIHGSCLLVIIAGSDLCDILDVIAVPVCDQTDLGMHSELCSDAYLHLYKAGKLTNKKKTIDRGKGVFGVAIGSSELYEWLDDNHGVAAYPLEYVNRPDVIAQIDNMVSINSCVSVDLYGQVSSESFGARQISGTGGQLDFLIGASSARGGKAFICMSSTYKDKSGQLFSRVLPQFNGDIITSPRSQVYFLATEYGVINMEGRSTWERAEGLISIAHPDFRDELIKEAEKRKIWRRSNKR